MVYEATWSPLQLTREIASVRDERRKLSGEVRRRRKKDLVTECDCKLKVTQ